MFESLTKAVDTPHGAFPDERPRSAPPKPASAATPPGSGYPSFLPVLRLAALLFAVLPLAPARAQLVISEFLAENRLGRKDGDGDTEDWIEIHNPGSQTVSLQGWSLTDSASRPRKWEFPATEIAPGGYLLVFASGKDRRVAGQVLHTNFRLETDGEYLALVRPDLTPSTEFAPAYPPQAPDVSFGFPLVSAAVPLLPPGAAGRYRVPTDDRTADTWTGTEFDDADWGPMKTGFGWDPAGVLAPHVVTRPDPGPPANASVYLRIPFVVTNLAEIADPVLNVHYDDGFAAHINGALVVTRNAPVETEGGLVADQRDDWDSRGGQGVHGWYYGYYDADSDPDRVYDAFSDFVNTGADWSWSGTAWELGPENPPWTLIGPDFWHPNGNDGGVRVHWAVRRWISQAAGRIEITFGGAKQNTACGNGVTFRLLHNGTPRFARGIGPADATGFAATVILDDVDFGDFIDFALDPTGPDGGTQDGCDGSTFHATIRQEANPGLVWNATALRSRSPAEVLVSESISLDAARDRLVPGTNVLAVQILNVAASDPTLLFAPEIVARTSLSSASNALYFPTPSPGAANGVGSATLGPRIDDTVHAPLEPADGEDLVVTAAVRPTLRPVASVRLTYRIQFGAEVVVPMFDDGRHGDGGAGDGTWGATIPAAASTPGQMIRWSVTATDSDTVAARHPRYPDPRRSPQYFGTVVRDPSLTEGRIPVLHWFIQNPGSADGDATARGSVFFEGEFYDNIGANVHGQSTRGFPKRSYDFDFNPGFKFRWREGKPRVDDFNLLTTWADKSHLRNVLAYETYEAAGAPAHFAIPVRVQQNGKFFSVANLVENGDDNFLERLGMDPRGALYKMYNVADSVSGAEKKTRKTEGTQDLAALIRGLTSGTSQARNAFLFDNLDLPAMVNFLAARAITGDTDCCHKNYYLYRDSDGSGEWSAFPWDVDLSFGRVWTCNTPCLSYFDETIYTNTALFVGNNNTVFSAVLTHPATRAMYLRRFRSLMDELTQPPGTPADQDRWRRRSTELRDLIAPDAALDLARWGTWGRRETITQAVDRIHREFLPGRRNYLFSTLTRAGTVPATQPTNATVRFARVEPRPASGNRFHEFLEITNANAFAVDLSDWRIDGPVRFRFKPGTVLPARSNAVVSPDRRQFRSRTTGPRGGQNLLVLGDYSGELDARGGELTLSDAKGRVVHSTQLPATPSAPQNQLRITELLANPAGSEDAADAEFVELRNLGPTTLDLAGVRFTEGIRFDFSTGAVRTLDPSRYVLVVRDLAAFRLRYGFGLPVAGVYQGQLDNAGESLRLEDPSGEPILDFDYSPASQPLADRFGHSLVVADASAPPERWSSSAAWTASASAGGSPGADEPPALAQPPVVIHEILAHTDPPLLDAVELHNPSSVPADISGWWLTDDPSTPKKYRVPAGTVVPAGGFLVLDESRFATPPEAPTAFTFSSHGDDVWLFATRPDGSFDVYRDGAEFPASANGVSFGRHTNSVGEVRWVPQLSRTLGGPNSGPSVGPVVITEILATPLRGDSPFVELRNISKEFVPLFDPNHPDHTWRLRGVDFSFPPGLTLPPGGFLVLTGGDPVAFRLRHGVPAGIPVLGPWPGSLDPDGERLSLERPDSPDLQPDGTTFVPFLGVDTIGFRARSPWPRVVPGTAIERVRASAWADDPAQWRANPFGVTPGIGSDANRPPTVSAGGEIAVESARFPVTMSLNGTVADDGLPEDPGRVSTLWSQVSGRGIVEIAEPLRTGTLAVFPGPDRYVLRLSASDGDASQSSEVVVDVRRPEAQPTVIPAGSSWRYWASKQAPPAAWTSVTFDDAAWPEGEAQLGYGDGDERTPVPDTVDGTKVFTAYFRRRFVVPDPAAVRDVRVRLVRDDGAALWLNGRSVLRDNLPEGTLAFDTPASATVAGTDEANFFEFPIEAAALRSGTNVLAVEVHQQSAGSSDISFDLELNLNYAATNRPPAADAGPEATATAGHPVRLVGVWDDDGLDRPATLRWDQLSGPSVARFSATNTAATDVTIATPGTYRLRFRVHDGSHETSDEMILTVIAPDSGYAAWRARYFDAAELLDPSIAGDAADPDRDRRSNREEYRSGTDPRDASSVLRLEARRGIAGGVELTLQAVADRAYRVEWRSAVSEGPWNLLQLLEARPSPGARSILDPGLPTSGPGRYYRVSTDMP